MATKAKKSASAKKGGKATKTTKSVKASPAKKNTAKVKKAKPAATRTNKAAKKSAHKAGSKKISAKPTAKSGSAKSKSAKSTKAKAANSKATASKKTTTAKPKTTSKKTAASSANKQGTAAKSAAPKLTMIKNDAMPSSVKAPAKKSVTEKKSTKSSHGNFMEVVDDILPYQEKFGEEYMNKKQQEHFRAILLQRKKEFMDEMERTVHHLQDEAANFPDPNDRATQEEEFGLVLRTRDRELKYIKNIEDALQRIDEGEYGYCEACGVEIGVRRLEARPTATLCIDCKTLDEIREKQMGG